MKELERLARGVLAIGFDGTQLRADLPRCAAYVLFARNVTSLRQVRTLTDALRAHDIGDGVSPLIAIDQEGGRVARLHDDVEAMPSAMALGAAGDETLARRAGEQTAFDLRRAGCSLDFAPVLDLARKAGNVAIGTRSFGDDPSTVAALGGAWLHGLRDGGVLPCCKHFPGHGATSDDSHAVLPAADDDSETLQRLDLAPFAALAGDVPAMMGTHVRFPAIDPSRPATLSPAIAALLRDRLQFSGAYVTDCLQMGALRDAGGLPGVAIEALAAGADLLTISHAPGAVDEIVAAIQRAAGDGRLPKQRLERAYARVLALRQMAASPLPIDTFPPHPGIGREIARRAVTLVRGVPHADATASIAISFEGDAAEGINVAAPERAPLQRQAPALSELRAPLNPDGDACEALLEALALSRRRPLLLVRRAHRYAGQVAAVERVAARYPDALAVSLLEPFDVPQLSAVPHVLATYGDDAAAIGGLADVLFGGSPPQGRFPVALRA